MSERRPMRLGDHCCIVILTRGCLSVIGLTDRASAELQALRGLVMQVIIGCSSTWLIDQQW